MTDDLRARAEELLAENATADRPDPRSWMDGADRIIRDLLAALPPDPAPTGERETARKERVIHAARAWACADDGDDEAERAELCCAVDDLDDAPAVGGK